MTGSGTSDGDGEVLVAGRGVSWQVAGVAERGPLTQSEQARAVQDQTV